jgi:hypothetical protein
VRPTIGQAEPFSVSRVFQLELRLMPFPARGSLRIDVFTTARRVVVDGDFRPEPDLAATQ